MFYDSLRANPSVYKIMYFYLYLLGWMEAFAQPHLDLSKLKSSLDFAIFRFGFEKLGLGQFEIRMIEWTPESERMIHSRMISWSITWHIWFIEI